MIKFAQFDENDLTPILNWPEMQHDPDPAFIRIYCDRKTVSAEPLHYYFDGVPMEFYCRHHLRFEIPNNITGRALNRVFESAEFRRLCERIINGYDTEFDGKNVVGVYSDDATAAIAELEQWLETNIDDADCVPVLTADDFVYDNRHTLGITIKTSDEEIKKMAEKIYQEIAADDYVLVGGVEALAEQMIDYRESLVWLEQRLSEYDRGENEL